jgi:hypothetical protein
MGLSNFKSELGYGARSNLFRCNIGVDTFLVKAASLPGVTIGEVNVPVLGRQLKLPGDVTFEQWSVTVLNNESYNIRTYLENWVAELADGVLNERDLDIQALDKKGGVLKSVTLIGAFPLNVSAIDMSFDNADTVSEFTCDFAYQYWE